jgi:hypothetical protein
MKIGKMEGSPEEINNFFQNNGLNISEYLEKPEPPLKPIWLIAPVCFIVVFLATLTLFTLNIGVMTFIFLLGCSAAIWLSAALQIRFKNTWAAVFVFVGILLIFLVAIGVVKPVEMIQYFNLKR